MLNITKARAPGKQDLKHLPSPLCSGKSSLQAISSYSAQTRLEIDIVFTFEKAIFKLPMIGLIND